jgi:uncharacterized protein (TIGR02996 family)
MGHDDVFLRAIIEDPDDDAPRLVYADWLDEHGQPERAELIRVECQLGRLLGSGPIRHHLECRARQLLCISDGVFKFEGHLSEPLEARDRDLLAAHGGRWAEPLHGLVDSLAFRRGFVEEVGIRGRAFPAEAGDLFRLVPVRHASFSHVSPVLAPHLAASPHLARLRSLSLAHNRVAPRGGRALGESPHLAGLRTLELTHCRVGDAGLEALLSSPRLARLEALHLWNNDLGPASARLLASPRTLPRLEYLSAGCNQFGAVGERVLRERFGIRVRLGLWEWAPG